MSEEFKDLLELEGNHALEHQHFHFGKDAFTSEEIAEVTATVGVLRGFFSAVGANQLLNFMVAAE